MGRLLIIAGIFLLLLGVVILYAPWMINWFGRLPGDIHIDSGRTKIFIPLTSMLLVSLVITLLVNLFKR